MKKIILCSFVAVIASLSIGHSQVLITTLDTAYTQNFNGMGSSATATLPTGFKVFANSAAPTWSGGTAATTLAAGTSGTGTLTTTSSGGVYNFADGVTASSTDRALGFITTGSFASPNSILYSLKNNTGLTIDTLSVSWDYEKFRLGTRAWDINFYTSTDGIAWTAVSSGNQTYAADGGNTVVNPATSISKSFDITGLNVADGSSFYLRWAFVGNGGSTNGQALGLDNFSILASSASAPIPEPSSFALLGLGAAFILYRRKLRLTI